MEVLIERKDVRSLKQREYSRVEEVRQEGNEVRIYLYQADQDYLVFLLIEPVIEGKCALFEHWLSMGTAPN